MNFHEYQAKQLFADYGIAVPAGRVARSPEEAVDAAKARIALDLDSDRFRMQAADAAVGVYKEMVVGALGALNSIASLSE